MSTTSAILADGFATHTGKPPGPGEFVLVSWREWAASFPGGAEAEIAEVRRRSFANTLGGDVRIHSASDGSGMIRWEIVVDTTVATRLAGRREVREEQVGPETWKETWVIAAPGLRQTLADRGVEMPIELVHQHIGAALGYLPTKHYRHWGGFASWDEAATWAKRLRRDYRGGEIYAIQPSPEDIEITPRDWRYNAATLKRWDPEASVFRDATSS